MEPSAVFHGMAFITLCELVLARFAWLGASFLVAVVFLVMPRIWVKLKLGSYYLGLRLFALSYLLLFSGMVPLVILLLVLLSMPTLSFMTCDIMIGRIAGAEKPTELFPDWW